MPVSILVLAWTHFTNHIISEWIFFGFIFCGDPCRRRNSLQHHMSRSLALKKSRPRLTMVGKMPDLWAFNIMKIKPPGLIIVTIYFPASADKNIKAGAWRVIAFYCFFGKTSAKIASIASEISRWIRVWKWRSLKMLTYSILCLHFLVRSERFVIRMYLLKQLVIMNHNSAVCLPRGK